MRLQKLSLPDVVEVQGRLSAIAAAEGITEEGVHRWAQEVRAEWPSERQGPPRMRVLWDANVVVEGGVFGLTSGTRPLWRMGSLAATPHYPVD